MKQLYDTSVLPDGPDRDGDDSDGSIITMGGNVEETSSEEEEGDEEDEDDDRNKEGQKGISAQLIMDKIGSAVHVMADEAEYASKTALKMYDMLMEQAEKRKEQRSGGVDNRNDSNDDSYSTYSDYDEDSFSSESEDSHVARNSRRKGNSYKNSSSRNRHRNNYRSSNRHRGSRY